MTTTEDDEYKQATKTVVDDAMRTDILGPNLCRVLEDHKPANDLLNDVIAAAVQNNPEVKNALTTFVNDHYDKRKGKWVDRAIWLVVGAALTGGVGYVISLFIHHSP